ncbi:MAG: hypothetical protein JXB32_04150 [Deltaproteobacteria bacterium]|nr:hypothetical protein [Deltaproteobacteria bacterium]
MSRHSRARSLPVATTLLVACGAVSGCWVEEIQIEPDGWIPDRDGDADGRDGPPVESCNGLDDDGDGATDEEFECVAGAERPCAEATCAGVQVCDPVGCTWRPCDFGPPPPHDSCTGALELAASGEYAGTTCGATDDHMPPAGCAGGGGRDVWYRFVLTERETVYADTADGNTWDSVLQLRWGECGGGLPPVVCADDQCPLVSGGRRSQLLEALDPGTYYLVVDGSAADEAGPFTLRFQHAACGSPTALSGNGNFDGTTTGREDRWAGSCGGEASPDVFYAFGLCEPRTVTASTCTPMPGFDSVLAFLGSGCSVADELACNDDDPECGHGSGRSTVTATLPAGLNFLVVDGRRSAGGAYRLIVSGL